MRQKCRSKVLKQTSEKLVRNQPVDPAVLFDNQLAAEFRLIKDHVLKYCTPLHKGYIYRKRRPPAQYMRTLASGKYNPFVRIHYYDYKVEFMVNVKPFYRE